MSVDDRLQLHWKLLAHSWADQETQMVQKRGQDYMSYGLTPRCAHLANIPQILPIETAGDYLNTSSEEYFTFKQLTCICLWILSTAPQKAFTKFSVSLISREI